MVKWLGKDFFSGGSGKVNKEAGKNTGHFGEETAVAYLKQIGYLIIERNYRKRFGEIDIVAQDGDVVVFVEVKTRRSVRFGSPFEAVDRRKQKNMTRVALAYLDSHKLFDRSARFDVVAVMLHKESGPEVEIVQDAFEMYDG